MNSGAIVLDNTFLNLANEQSKKTPNQVSDAKQRLLEARRKVEDVMSSKRDKDMYDDFDDDF